MSPRTRIVPALAALVVAPAPASALGRPAWQRYVHRQLDRVVAEGVPGALSLVRGTQRTWQITSGVANRKTKAPMRAFLRYRIGSETKTFVAALTLKLAEEGLLSLDDADASDIVPSAARRAFARAALASFCRSVPKRPDVARLTRPLQTTR